jgi:hypothetical protein
MILYFAKTGLTFAFLYGVCLGTFAGPLQMLSSAVKTPMLFFFPLVICSPSLFTFNIVLGTQMTYKQIVVLLLAMTYMSAVVLSSFAPIMLFFILTGGTYKFTLLLNVGMCGVAGTLCIADLLEILEWRSIGDSADGFTTKPWNLQ